MQCGSMSSSWCTAGRCRLGGPYELNGCDGDRLTYGWRPMVDTVLSSTSSSSSDRPSMTSFSFGLWRDRRSRPLTRILTARPFHCRRSTATNSPDRNLGVKCFERSFIIIFAANFSVIYCRFFCLSNPLSDVIFWRHRRIRHVSDVTHSWCWCSRIEMMSLRCYGGPNRHRTAVECSSLIY